MKPIKRAIALCWIMLVACFVIKLFGGNLFEIVCTNEHFSNLCRFVDENFWLSEIVGFVLYVPSTIIIMLSASLIPKPSKETTVEALIIIIAVWLTHYIGNVTKTICEILAFVVSPFLLNITQYDVYKTDFVKKRWFLGIIGYVVVMIFQIISVITRNIGVKFTDDSLLITFFLMIDYYIMVLLYYLYVKLKKGDKSNG